MPGMNNRDSRKTYMSAQHLHSLSRSLYLGIFLLVGCANVGSPATQAIPAASSAATKEDGYGAIAFSAATQRWHIRWNVSDQARADTLASRYCGAEDCAVVLRYGPGQCGTFSLGDDGALGTGSGDTETAAASAALAACRLSDKRARLRQCGVTTSREERPVRGISSM